MARTKAERLAAVHAEALELFDRIEPAVRQERLQCYEDRRFYSIAGAQWEGALGDQFENKPRFELNKVHLSVVRIINEYRNNRVTVQFLPKDGTPNDKFADVCNGLFRADEQTCTALEAYDNAYEEGVGGGFGAWRVCAAYEDDEDDDNDQQRVSIEPIFDADTSVYFDLDAKRQDKSDAKHCFVLTAKQRDAYEEEYDDDPAGWPTMATPQYQYDWTAGDVVMVAEYYRVEQTEELIHFYRGLDEKAPDMRVPQSELDADPTKADTLAAMGFREVRQKRIKRQRVHKYILSGGKVLEDCGYIAGRCIPIVPCYGKRWIVGGIERCMGHVRLAKDAQRLVNMLMSWLAEMAARFDIEKPILTPEQIAGHAHMWAQDNVAKFPYLLINPVTDAATGQATPIGPVGYTKAPNIPPAMAALLQIAEQSLQDLLGNQQAGEQLQPNLSGKAVELIQNRLDMQVFIYMSNLAKAMKRCGEIWLSMKKEITAEQSRAMKSVGSDGTVSSVVVNQPAYDAETGEDMIENDLSEASFDVVVDVGPSSASQRAATVRALTGIASITQDPETLQALTLATIANLEGEGLTDLRGWARQRAIRAGILKPTEDERTQLEAEQQQSQGQIDPQSQYLLAASQEAAAKAEKARADTLDTIAASKLKEAQTQKTLADIGHAAMGQKIDVAALFAKHATPPRPYA